MLGLNDSFLTTSSCGIYLQCAGTAAVKGLQPEDATLSCARLQLPSSVKNCFHFIFDYM